MEENNISSEFTKFAYDFHQTMLTQNLMLAYEGEVTQQLTKAFATMAEQNMEKESEDNSVKRKVFHVMVECLQNICKHTDHVESGESIIPGSGIFLVGKNDDHYTVTTGNSVSIERCKKIEEMLSNINDLDADGLKQLYKKQLKESRLSEKGGAGLGFIDIAKKTGQKIGFDFISVNDKTNFFLLKVKIPRS